MREYYRILHGLLNLIPGLPSIRPIFYKKILSFLYGNSWKYGLYNQIVKIETVLEEQLSIVFFKEKDHVD